MLISKMLHIDTRAQDGSLRNFLVLRPTDDIPRAEAEVSVERHSEDVDFLRLYSPSFVPSFPLQLMGTIYI